MAVTVTDNLNTLNDLDTSASFSTIGGGPGASILSAMVYEGSAAAARRIGTANTDFGFWVTEGTTININTAGSEAFWFKGFVKQRGALNANGMRLRLGDSQSDYYEWTMGDDGTIPQPQYEYPIPGGFIVAPVFVGLRAWHDIARTGTPDVTIIDEYAITANVSITANGEDMALDALSWGIDGLFMTGGTPDGTFQDFVDDDEGDTTGGRFGMWQVRSGIMFVFAKHVIGRVGAAVTATQFTDSFKTLVFPGGKTDTGFNGFEFDLGNASTTVSWSNINLSGQGRSTYKIYFDTELDVTGGATDTINVPAHDFTTGDQVQYSAEGGTEDIGPDATNGEGALVTGTTIPSGDRWYVIVSDSDTIQLASTFANALAGTATDLTPSSAGNGEQHSLTRTPDTRPDIDVVGTSGSADLTSCVFNRVNAFTLTSAVTLDSCVLAGCGSLSLASGTVQDCTIESPEGPAEGEAFLTAATVAELADVSDNIFNSSGRGHAIEITTTGGSPSVSGNVFTGYKAEPSTPGTGWQFDTETDVTGGATDTITYTSHGFTTGDPVYYSQEGITTPENIGLVEDTLYWVRADDSDTIGVFLSREGAETNTNRISLTPSSGGQGETHALYSANAAIHNSTGGSITLNIDIDGDTPSIRNSNGSSTSVDKSVTLTVTVKEPDGTAVEGARVRIERSSDGSLISDGSTNASGIHTDSFAFVSDVPVTIKTRLKGFKNFRTTGTITNTGLNVGVRFQPDNIVDLP